jgi:hypothetical protein
MKTISYKGELYTQASSHKKCEKGTHWNELKKKCMKLPRYLVNARVNASRTSAYANKHPKGTLLARSHGYGASNHRHAARVHEGLASYLKDKGFVSLARGHQAKADNHNKLAKASR